MSDYPIKWHKTTHGFDDDLKPIRDRESYLYITEVGTVEAWRTKAGDADPFWNPTGYYGGIEVHSKTPMYDGQKPLGRHCELTHGDCYTDGSSLAFEQVERFFDTPAYVFSVLADWAESNLNTITTKEN